MLNTLRVKFFLSMHISVKGSKNMFSKIKIKLIETEFINLFINIFSIFSGLFVLIQFERYEGNSEKWDLLLFFLLLSVSALFLFAIYKKKNFLFQNNPLLSLVGAYSIFKGVSVKEYRTWPGIDGPAENFLWFGFGFEVFFLAVLISPFIINFLFSNKLYFKIVRVTIFLYLVSSFLLSYFQTTNSLIDVVHSSYIFDEILSARSGQYHYQNFIPQYQSFYTFLSYFFKNDELIGFIDMILILIYALTLLIYFMSIKIIKGSYKNFNLINSAVIFTPFLIAAPIFYNRIGYGGTMAALLTGYPVRILPFFLIFHIFMKSFNFSKENTIFEINKKYLLTSFFLCGINILNNFEFGLAILFSLIATLVILDLIANERLVNTFKTIYTMSFASLFGFVSVIVFYNILNLEFNFNYIGWWFRQYAQSNALGTKIQIPGPSQFVLPILFSTFISHCYYLNKYFNQYHENKSIIKNSITGLGFSLFSVLGMPYYIGRSFASGQLQIFLLPIALSFSILLGTVLTINKDSSINLAKIKLKNINSIFFITIVSLFISTAFISATPKSELNRILDINTNWPTESQITMFDEISKFHEINLSENIGFFGDFSNIVFYQTNLHPIANVSGIDNVKNNSIYTFQNYLYNEACKVVDDNKFDYIVADVNADKSLKLEQNGLCSNYKIDENFQYSEIFILKRK